MGLLLRYVTDFGAKPDEHGRFPHVFQLRGTGVTVDPASPFARALGYAGGVAGLFGLAMVAWYAAEVAGPLEAVMVRALRRVYGLDSPLGLALGFVGLCCSISAVVGLVVLVMRGELERREAERRRQRAAG